MSDLSTDATITWCPGCGNFGILNAFQKAVEQLEEKGVPRKALVVASGIGCHGKIVDYLELNSFYSLHGRSVATIEGITLANPDLKVATFVGDGDSFGEGLAHLIFAAKRNADITVIVHDNGAYALTTGQFSPTSERGYKGPSTPEGNVEDPLNPLALLLDAGATFIARGYAGKIDHLATCMVRAIEHEGFSLVHVLQPSVVFRNTYQLYNELVEVVDTPDGYEGARDLIRERVDETERMPVGIFYERETPSFTARLLGDHNPVTEAQTKKERRDALRTILTK